MKGRNLCESWRAQGWCRDWRGRIWLLTLSGSSARCGIDQLRVGEGEVALIGAARGHGEFDAPEAGSHQRADLEELETDRAAGRFGGFGLLQSNTPPRPDQR